MVFIIIMCLDVFLKVIDVVLYGNKRILDI